MGVGNGVVGEGLEGGCGGVDLGAGRQREDPPANKSDTKSFKKFPTPHRFLLSRQWRGGALTDLVTRAPSIL